LALFFDYYSILAMVLLFINHEINFIHSDIWCSFSILVLFAILKSRIPIYAETPESFAASSGTAGKEIKDLSPGSDLAKPVYSTPSPITPTLSPGNADLNPTPTPLPTFPKEFNISFRGHPQAFSIDCEASAAVDWAAFYGVTIKEVEFQFKIPVSDDPDYGFVGNINSPWGMVPPFAYGVYAEPIAKLLNDYGVPASAVRNASFDNIKLQISQNNPVMVWIIGSMEKSKAIVYSDMLGRQTIVAPYEHVVILTGYNEKKQSISYMSEGKLHKISYKTFLESWKILGNMTIIRSQ
jgi:uncharacterized protein YvpB